MWRCSGSSGAAVDGARTGAGRAGGKRLDKPELPDYQPAMATDAVRIKCDQANCRQALCNSFPSRSDGISAEAATLRRKRN